MRSIVAILLAALLIAPLPAQQTSASASVNGSPSPQGLNYQKVNGFVPIVNGFPVIVGESIQNGLTASSYNQILYASTANPYTTAWYKIFCTVAATATSAGVVALSVSYTDAATQAGTAFSLTMGTVTLSTSAPTLINAINIAASDKTSITLTTVLVSGTATFNVACYVDAENHL
jgi:hypothetical protein